MTLPVRYCLSCLWSIRLIAAVLFQSIGTLTLATAQSVGQPAMGQKVSLGSGVNTPDDESGAVLTVDGQTLYFVRTRQVGEGALEQNIYQAQKQPDGTWGQVSELGSPVNTAMPNQVLGVSADGRRIYLSGLYMTERRQTPGISVSERGADGRWGIPRRVATRFDVPAEGFFSGYVHPDERVMILSMAGPGALGAEDLYISQMGPDGVWGDLTALPIPINSTSFEATPSLSPDGQILYFSSDRPGGSGSADIYRCIRQGNGWSQWSPPENMGRAINTAGFEASVTSSPALGEGFIMTGSNPGRGASGDLFLFIPAAPTPPPAQAVASAPVEPPQPVRTAEEVVPAPAPGLRLRQEASRRAVRPLVLNFPTNGDRLTAAQQGQLRRWMATQRRGDGAARIAIEGHADAQGNPTYNQALSARRAEAVERFLTTQGIDRSRVETEALGDTRPLGDNGTAQGRARNRRVEVRIDQ